MARPSLKEQRRSQILDAMERCVSRYGVEGATLERIAEEAGVRRSALRHFVGNRDALVAALCERFLARAAEQNAALREAARHGLTAQGLLDILFDPGQSDTRSVLIAEALIAAAANDDRLAEGMANYVAQFAEVVADLLGSGFPHAAAQDCSDVAAGIVGIYFNVESLAPLGPRADMRNASLAAARRLIDTLRTS